MIRVFAASGTIYVDGWEAPFPAGSLVAQGAGQTVSICSRNGDHAIVAAGYDGIGRRDGTGFATVAACLTYLADCFAARADAGTLVATYTAAGALGGHRIVRTLADGRVAYASSDDPSSVGTVIGLTTGAATGGALIDVVGAGPVDEPGWSFLPGLVFLGVDGALTQTPPTSGVELRIGAVLLPTRVVIAIGDPYFLASP